MKVFLRNKNILLLINLTQHGTPPPRPLPGAEVQNILCYWHLLYINRLHVANIVNTMIDLGIV